LKLENLTNNENNIDVNEINTLEKGIREYYENQFEAAILRHKTDWFEQGEKSTSYYFRLRKEKEFKFTVPVTMFPFYVIGF
jgi:hypothetical protein